MLVTSLHTSMYNSMGELFWRAQRRFVIQRSLCKQGAVWVGSYTWIFAYSLPTLSHQVRNEAQGASATLYQNRWNPLILRRGRGTCQVYLEPLISLWIFWLQTPVRWPQWKIWEEGFMAKVLAKAAPGYSSGSSPQSGDGGRLCGSHEGKSSTNWATSMFGLPRGFQKELLVTEQEEDLLLSK